MLFKVDSGALSAVHFGMAFLAAAAILNSNKDAVCRKLFFFLSPVHCFALPPELLLDIIFFVWRFCSEKTHSKNWTTWSQTSDVNMPSYTAEQRLSEHVFYLEIRNCLYFMSEQKTACTSNNEQMNWADISHFLHSSHFIYDSRQWCTCDGKNVYFSFTPSTCITYSGYKQINHQCFWCHRNCILHNRKWREILWLKNEACISI